MGANLKKYKTMLEKIEHEESLEKKEKKCGRKEHVYGKYYPYRCGDEYDGVGRAKDLWAAEEAKDWRYLGRYSNEREYNYWENKYDTYNMHVQDGCNGD